MRTSVDTIKECIMQLSDASIEPSIREILLRHCDIMKATEHYQLTDAFITGYHNGCMNELYYKNGKPLEKESDARKWYESKYGKHEVK